MTGTGTQSDPYVPITLTEFIEAVGTSGAYVALDRDIYAAEDPAYTGELTSGIQWQAAVTDGNGHVVSGITVRNSTSAMSLRRGITVQDLSLIKFAHVKESSTVTIGFAGSGQNAKMVRCNISARIVAGSYNHFFAEELIADDCAFDLNIIETTSNAWNTFLKNVVSTRCTMRIHGCFMVKSSGSYMMEHGTYARSAMIFEYAESTDGGTVSAATSDCKFTGCYLAFIRAGTSGTFRTLSSVSTSSVIASDGSIDIHADTGFTEATLAQLKDEAWLASVGFLP